MRERHQHRIHAYAGSLLLACAVVGTTLIGGTAAGTEPWRWQSDELETIGILEAKVKTRRGKQRLKTRNWIVETQSGARFTAELGLFMERFLETFSEVLKGRSVVPVKPTIVVTESEAEYRERFDTYSRGRFKYRHDQNGHLTEFHIYTYPEAGGRKFVKFPHATLLHEGTHALLQSYLGLSRIPPWFTEGLAEHFESWDLRLDEEQNRRVCHMATAVRVWHSAIRRNDGLTAMPIQQILSLGYDTPWVPDSGGPRTGRNYAVTAAFTDFLLSSAEKKKTLVDVFGRLSQGVDPRKVMKREEIERLTPQWEAHWRGLIETAKSSDELLEPKRTRAPEPFKLDP